MILFAKCQFEQRRIAVVIEVADFEIHFKLVEVIRALFNMCEHTYIDKMHVRVFEEFPNTKYITLGGLMVLAELSPQRDVARRLQFWAQDLNRRTFTNRCFGRKLL